ncbi:TetR/AcrR family transcriptional regulator [Metabacillus litoralis]|jgi:AcrR family transcriptional regulator|uniref:TetR/AcrR family transcriptional regulator n=1 Tax=Metabacillus litoralis TaxID=152268 RepID=UPI00203C2D51|nr:TetR/AcrR family transcriptional regulator [Metabacillus litoralis]MCM3651661.1 TetR/AcrR family transcriptional regulator [Metabacillus litoralis]
MSVHEDELLVGKYPYVPKQKRAQQKRSALLESGRALFIEKGYEQTNAKEIASHAGVATGTFYRYFSDKRQLMMSLLEDQMESLLPPEPIWPNVDPEAFLATLWEQHFQRLDKLGLYRVLPELLLKDAQFAEILAEAKRKIHTRIHLSLIHAKELGIIWDDLDLDTVSWAIMVLSEKIPEKQHESGKQLDYHDLSKIICRFVFPPEVLKQLKSEEKNK